MESGFGKPGTDVGGGVGAPTGEPWLSDLPAWLADVDAARTLRLTAGERLDREGSDQGGSLDLLVEGLLRLFVEDERGRQATLRYVFPGEVVDHSTWLLEGGPRDREATTRLGSEPRAVAIRASRLVRLKAPPATAVPDTGEAAWALAEDLAAELAQVQGGLTSELFLPVRSRVAAHLLELVEQDGSGFTVRVTQQSIATAIGSVREVVSRIISQLEHERLLRRARDPTRIVLLDRAALHRVAKAEG